MQRRREFGTRSAVASSYQVRALRALLEEAAADELGSVPGGAPLTLLGDVLWFYGDPKTNRALLERFVDSMTSTGTTDGWPENQQWYRRVQ